MTTMGWTLTLMSLAALLGACSDGAADTKSAAASGSSYTKTCARTVCDTCRARVSENCSACYAVCSSPSAYSGCAADCSDLCASTCRACESGSNTCQDWEVRLPLPALDEPLFDSCLRTYEACAPTDYDRSYCNYIARTMQPAIIEQFDCVNRRGCEAREECMAAPEHVGALGDEVCARSKACGQPCDPDHASFLNGIADTLRPGLVRSLEQCMAEPSCAEFEACAAAHDELWQLAWEKADPGSPSECSEQWLSECETCGCGFSCVRGCPTCTKRCVVPCYQDADCVGTSTGLAPTPICSRYGDDPGYCSFSSE